MKLWSPLSSFSLLYNRLKLSSPTSSSLSAINSSNFFYDVVAVVCANYPKTQNKRWVSACFLIYKSGHFGWIYDVSVTLKFIHSWLEPAIRPFIWIEVAKALYLSLASYLIAVLLSKAPFVEVTGFLAFHLPMSLGVGTSLFVPIVNLIVFH